MNALNHCRFQNLLMFSSFYKKKHFSGCFENFSGSSTGILTKNITLFLYTQRTVTRFLECNFLRFPWHVRIPSLVYLADKPLNRDEKEGLLSESTTRWPILGFAPHKKPGALFEKKVSDLSFVARVSLISRRKNEATTYFQILGYRELQLPSTYL